MRLHSLPIELQKSLQQHSLLKIISGLDNFERLSVECVAFAAGQGGADLLDVACDPDLVRLAIEVSGLPVCVSAVEPNLFPAAVSAGASMVEIGNFDSFYPKGRFFDADEVLHLTLQTRELLPDVPLSVTVPHVLPLDEQAALALSLVNLGVDFIQTEGGTSAKPFSAGSLGLIEKASPTLAATHSIAHAMSEAKSSVPLICASGLSSVTVPMAIASGASGVGIGSAINKLKDQVAMIAAVSAIREAMDLSFSNRDKFGLTSRDIARG